MDESHGQFVKEVPSSDKKASQAPIGLPDASAQWKRPRLDDACPSESLRLCDDSRFLSTEISKSDAILILAGAGLSAGSTDIKGKVLPDYRSPASFAASYPHLASRGLTYVKMASARMFDVYPKVAWGFYAQRMQMYGSAQPHTGYGRLLKALKQKDYFVFTSNVDGLFEKAGFAPERIVECHGNLRRTQCSTAAQHGVWRSESVLKRVRFSENAPNDLNGDIDVVIAVGASEGDGDQSPVHPPMQAVADVPVCRAFRCKSISRPNVLLFGDVAFNGGPVEKQLARYTVWLQRVFGEKQPDADDNNTAVEDDQPRGMVCQSVSPRARTGDVLASTAYDLGAGVRLSLEGAFGQHAVSPDLGPTHPPPCAHDGDMPRGGRLLLLEIGAGFAVPTVREQTQSVYLDAMAHGCDVSVVRLNTQDSAEDRRFVGHPDHFHLVKQRADAVLSLLRHMDG
eukprot:m.338618 g.338618  ORF g.338618 m.338618 type:complete len:454 (+) comp20563_c0_seq1:367-1728(+)